MQKRTRYVIRPRSIGADMLIDAWDIMSAIEAFCKNVGLELCDYKRNVETHEGVDFDVWEFKIGTGNSFYAFASVP